MRNAHARSAKALAKEGLALVGKGDVERGYKLCLASMLLSPSLDGCVAFTHAFFTLQDFERALPFASEGLGIEADNAFLNYTAAVGLFSAQRHEEALELFSRAIAAAPEAYEPKLSRALVLAVLGRNDESIEGCREVLSADTLSPTDRENTTNNLACVYMLKGMPDQALAILDDAYPDTTNDRTLFYKAIVRLGRGDWPQAWHTYRARHGLHLNGAYPMPQVPLPRAATLDDLRNKSVLLCHEQGMGDSIQFLRYAPQLRELAKDLVIWVPTPLVRLAETMVLGENPSVTAYVTEDVGKACDVAVGMMDLPALFNTTVATIPSHRCFGPVPAEILETRRLRYTVRPRVGLCWRGMSRKENVTWVSTDAARSVDFADGIGHLIASFSHQVAFVSLQRTAEHRVPNYYRRWVEEPIADDFDFLDTAAVVDQLDLVITVDTAVAHLAASYGKPVWLLSRYDGCWRWFFDYRRTSPWYPSMKIYRQTELFNWTATIDCVIGDLAGWLMERRAAA